MLQLLNKLSRTKSCGNYAKRRNRKDIKFEYDLSCSYSAPSFLKFYLHFLPPPGIIGLETIVREVIMYVRDERSVSF